MRALVITGLVVSLIGLPLTGYGRDIPQPQGVLAPEKPLPQTATTPEPAAEKDGGLPWGWIGLGVLGVAAIGGAAAAMGGSGGGDGEALSDDEPGEIGVSW